MPTAVDINMIEAELRSAETSYITDPTPVDQALAESDVTWMSVYHPTTGTEL